MKIQYMPQDEAAQNNPLPIETNIGSFLPGQIVTVHQTQEKEAARLVANGDFVETDADGSEGASMTQSVKAAVKKAAEAVTDTAKAAVAPKKK